MSYVDGYVLPVPTANKEAYRSVAEKVSRVLREFGALRIVEAWGHDVPHGTGTDFFRATQAKDGETVVFSWVLWPDKTTRDAGWGKLMADERMKPGGDMPFDGKRMFWGGFEPIVDEGQG